jgi:hypothetical protein
MYNSSGSAETRVGLAVSGGCRIQAWPRGMGVRFDNRISVSEAFPGGSLAPFLRGLRRYDPAKFSGDAGVALASHSNWRVAQLAVRRSVKADGAGSNPAGSTRPHGRRVNTPPRQGGKAGTSPAGGAAAILIAVWWLGRVQARRRERRQWRFESSRDHQGPRIRERRCAHD